MKPRFIFIHGNGGTDWRSPWTIWLKSQLESLGFETVFETFPDPAAARAEYWLPHLKDVIKAGENDILIGYSSGSVAAMRYAETDKILGSILISPSYTDLGDELEKQSGYFDAPWLWKNIKSNQKKIAMIWGDNDPYISQAEFAYIVLHLGPERIKVFDGEHFMDRQDMPEVITYVKQAYKNFLS
jgi:predicted alpha/beta hydrolase family esterase